MRSGSTTRQKRLNYRVLNDESEGESSPEDHTDESSEPSEPPSHLTRTVPACQDDAVILANIPDCELLPSESVASASIPRELNRSWYFNHKPRIFSMLQMTSAYYRMDLGVLRDYSR